MTLSPPSKSALTLQLEEYGNSNASNNALIQSSCNPDYHSKKSASYTRSFLQKMSRMISDERWQALDEFLRSPDEVAAYHGFELDFNSLSLDMASNILNPNEVV